MSNNCIIINFIIKKKNAALNAAPVGANIVVIGSGIISSVFLIFL